MQKKVYPKVTRTLIKLRIDAEDILSDAIAFYKRNDFDLSRRIRVYFNGQPAIDTGGVKRQYCSETWLVKEEHICRINHAEN